MSLVWFLLRWTLLLKKTVLEKPFSFDQERNAVASGIADESEELSRLGVDEDFYIPPVMIYFKDDLTSA